MSTEPFAAPPFQALTTLFLSVVESPPPRLIEMTLEPRVCVQLMQFATSEVRPVPAAVRSALQIAKVALGVVPATPTPLLLRALIVPATCVPCMLSSTQVPSTNTPPVESAQ